LMTTMMTSRRVSDMGSALVSLRMTRTVAEETEGHQHPAGGHEGWCEQMFPLPSRGSEDATPGFFVYFNTKSCIVMHSLAQKMDIISVFINALTKTHWGK